MATNIQHRTILNQPSPEALNLPFFNLLPKDKVSLLKFRIYILTRCIKDAEFRQDINEMCRRDVAFFATTMCWIHETRDDAFTETAGKFPMVLWTDQVDILAWLAKYGGSFDMTVEKTRGIGMSWIGCIFLLWKWLYHGEHLDYGILSKDENSLDLKDRPGSLMGKLDLLFAGLPGWLQLGPDGKSVLIRTSSKTHKFEHKINRNAILGFTATDDKLRSARTNLMLVDEAAYLPVDVQRWLAASQFVSSSRILISTHDGTATMFYRLTNDKHSRLVRISTWWNDNPARARGMYKIVNNLPVLLDPTFDYNDYDFCLEDSCLPRSPWVDSEFSKPGLDKVRLKQEIYGVAALDMKRMIQPAVTKCARELCRYPAFRAELVHDELTETEDGPFYFWQEYSSFTGMYYVGVDPAIGVMDKALAALVAIDIKTGSTVATAAFENTNGIDLAKMVHILCEKLCGARGQGYAQVVPESTGIGITFITELKRRGWKNIFNDGKGVHNSDRGEKLLIEYGRALRDGDTVAMDSRIIDDLEHFEYNSKVDVVFTGEIGHGDLGQAAALAWWGAKDRRKVILDTENRPQDRSKQPIELEPEYGYSKRKKSWSDKFALKV